MKVNIVSRGFVNKTLPKRRKWSHKGESGRLLVVGGNEMYTGAPVLAGMAGYRAGCDLVVLTAPERVANTAALFSPDMITLPLKGNVFSKKHLKRILELAEKSDAAVVGNGIGRERGSVLAVKEFLENTSLPCVVDADAIYAVEKRMMRKNMVLTPHSGEFFALSGKRVGETVEERVRAVKRYAKSTGCIVLLKGAVDVISDGERTAINRTGNACMSKGGTGDVLAGLCGGLLAMGVNPFEAACAAAWINGSAGDRAFRKHGLAMIASDVLGEVSGVVKTITK